MKLAPPLLSAALLLAGCDNRQGPWTGFVYRSQDAQTYEALLGFKDFEQCQEASIRRLRTYQEPDKGYYMCTKQCRWDETMQSNICAEKRD